MTPADERRLADALRVALEKFEASQRAAMQRLKAELVEAIWPGEPQQEARRD
jgi:hypothetical protein